MYKNNKKRENKLVIFSNHSAENSPYSENTVKMFKIAAVEAFFLFRYTASGFRGWGAQFLGTLKDLFFLEGLAVVAASVVVVSVSLGGLIRSRMRCFSAHAYSDSSTSL